MKLKFILILSLLLINLPINAQEGWFWQNPLPQGNRLTSLCFTDGNIGAAVGDHGAIIRTTDGGENWIVQNSNTTSYLKGVSFSDSFHGTAVGLNGTIIRTTDGGEHWFDQASGTTELLQAVHFTNQTLE